MSGNHITCRAKELPRLIITSFHILEFRMKYGISAIKCIIVQNSVSPRMVGRGDMDTNENCSYLRWIPV
jgi:hypothetical protein